MHVRTTWHFSAHPWCFDRIWAFLSTIVSLKHPNVDGNCVSVHHALWILCNSQYLDKNCPPLYTDRWGKLCISAHSALMETARFHPYASIESVRFCSPCFYGNCVLIYTVVWWKMAFLYTVLWWKFSFYGNQACLYPMLWWKNMHFFQIFFCILCYHDLCSTCFLGIKVFWPPCFV